MYFVCSHWCSSGRFQTPLLQSLSHTSPLKKKRKHGKRNRKNKGNKRARVAQTKNSTPEAGLRMTLISDTQVECKNFVSRSNGLQHQVMRMTAPRLLSTAKKTPPDVCLRSTLLASSSVIRAASAARLHPCFASSLNCSSISSFFILCSAPKKMSKVPLYLLMYLFSVLHVDPFNNVHLTIFDSFSVFTVFLCSSL